MARRFRPRPQEAGDRTGSVSAASSPAPRSRRRWAAWAVGLWALLLPAMGLAATTTEADGSQGFAAIREQYGLSGSGIRVGVIASGMAGVAESVASGDLPPTTFQCASSAGTVTRTDGCRASETLVATGNGITGKAFPEGLDLAPVGHAEGTAMLEVVHDLAPGASLWFAGVRTALDIPAALTYLAPNVDVVVLGLNAPDFFPDGQNTLTRAVAFALSSAGIRARAFIQAAGDAADRHYSGFYTDSGEGDEFGHYHRFSAGGGTTGPGTPAAANTVTVAAGGWVKIHLTWNDPAGAASNDYDLILVDCATHDLVDISTGSQRGGTEPSEVVAFQNRSAVAPVDVCYTIQNYLNDAAPRVLDVAIEGDVVAHAYNTPGQSLLPPADAPGDLLVVGAVPVRSPGQVESSSSFGPTFDGRARPDLVATDAVSVSGAGGYRSTFVGTAAAAAHAAGLAALLLELDPTLTRSGLKALLTQTAAPLGDPGASGAGRIDPVAAAQRALVGGPISSLTIVADREPPQTAGTTIHFTALARGGTRPYACQWWVTDGTNWTMVQDWGACTFAWTPSQASPSGGVGVWIRSAGKPGSPPEATRALAFAVTDPTPLVLTGIGADRVAPQPAGTTVTFVANAQGGIGPYACQWWETDGAGWTMVRDWGACTYAWTPTRANPNGGVGVWIRSAGRTGGTPEATRVLAFAVTDPAPLVLTGIGADRVAPQPAGTTVTFVANAQGGIGPYACRWWETDGVGWTMVQDWGACTYAWRPTRANPGGGVGVWIRSAGQTGGTPEATRALTFAIK